MLIKESEYLKKIIQELPKEKLKILNFGSQSSFFLKTQRHINENIINTVSNGGYSIINLDIQDIDGVDLVGDIFDDVFFSKLKLMCFDVVFVFNLLEHVTNLELMILRIQELVEEDKYIIFSGPNDYPIHFDPIDNLFRPNVEEVKELFTQCEVIKGQIIIDYTYSKYYFSSIKTITYEIFRTLAFFYKFNKWKKVVLPKYKWFFKKYRVTCVLMQKI